MLKPIYSILLFSLLFRKLTLAHDTTVTTTFPADAPTGKYIVVLKPNATEDTLQTHLTYMSQQLISEKHLHSSHLQHNSAKTNLSYSSIGGFKWYTGHFQTDTVNSLANGSAQDAVHYVVEDIILNSQEMVQTSAPSWGIDRIDQRHGTDGDYRFPSKQGQGVTIYVIDTGMDISHSDIVGRATHGPTFIGNTSDPTDSNGHGTFVAGVCCGTRYGVAKQADIVSVKALNSDGDGQLSNVLEAMNWVVQQHQSDPAAKSVINLSLGAKYNQATNQAVEEAIGLGIHFAIAAGNYGMDACQFSPASAQGALVVGAIDEDDSVSYYSNFGACVDIFAPGTNIKSIWNTGSDSTHTLSGTSMASPHAAGAMALFLSQKDYTPSSLIQHIKHVSTLLNEDFLLNSTTNQNETVLDNATKDGYNSTNPNIPTDESTLVNILYNHPADNQALLVYDQPIQGAASSAAAGLTTIITLVLASILLL